MSKLVSRGIRKRAGWPAGALALLFLLSMAAQSAGAKESGLAIVFLIDDSASITPNNYAMELQGLAAALGDPAIMPNNGSVAAAVLQFSTTVRTVVPLQPITALSMISVPLLIQVAPQEGGSTDLASGLRAATAVLQDGPSGTRRVICVITDGMPDDPVAALGAASDAMRAGISEIDALGVGRLVDASFLAALASPKPPATFAIVDSFQALAQAIAAKTREFVSAALPGRPGETPSSRELLSLEGLLHGQEGLIRSFADLLQSQWQALSSQERVDRTLSLERLLHSQQDLLERFAKLIDASVCPQLGIDPQLVFVDSFEGLLHSQADLLLRFEQILMAFGKPSAEFIASLENLIHGQGGLIGHFENILHCLSQLPSGVPAEMWNKLLSSFEDLIRSQEALIRGFSAFLG